MKDNVAGLVKRLDDLAQAVDQVGVAPTWTAAASTIRALDAKLREAVEVMRLLLDTYGRHNTNRTLERARACLATMEKPCAP